jgi:hypothetical protein
VPFWATSKPGMSSGSLFLKEARRSAHLSFTDSGINCETWDTTQCSSRAVTRGRTSVLAPSDGGKT